MGLLRDPQPQPLPDFAEDSVLTFDGSINLILSLRGIGALKWDRPLLRPLASRYLKAIPKIMTAKIGKNLPAGFA